MNGILVFFIVILALATLVVLGRGIFLMASGTDTTGVRQNKLMTLRVALQAGAVLCIVLFLLATRR